MLRTFLVPSVPMYQGLQYEVPDSLANELINLGLAERVENESKESQRPKRRPGRPRGSKALSKN